MFAFDPYNIIAALVVTITIQGLFFVYAATNRTDKVTDFAYSFNFLVLALLGLLANRAFAPVQILSAVAVSLWSLRLGGYLFMRILKIGKDPRFNNRREDTVKFLGFWVLQALAVWLIMMPVTIVTSLKNLGPLPGWAWIGLILWATGLIIEAVGDNQKFRFKSNHENRGRWIESGLWKYSRHPNYFGETLLWWGLYLFNLPYLTGWLHFAVIGPVFITILLLFVSGIPLLEQSADEKFGSDPLYQEYKKRTSIFLLLPPRKG